MSPWDGTYVMYLLSNPFTEVLGTPKAIPNFLHLSNSILYCPKKRYSCK